MKNNKNHLPTLDKKAMNKKIIIVIFLMLWSKSCFSQNLFSIDGYYKNFFVVYDLPEYKKPTRLGDRGTIGAVNNKLRLNLFYNPEDWLSFVVNYNISPLIQDQTLFTSQPVTVGIDPYSYRIADIDSRLYPSENDTIRSFGVLQNLDRASVTINTACCDIFIGRQAIAWGYARVINPTDVVAPYTFDELDIEDRIGVDAIRARFPIGFMGEFDAGYIAGDDFKFDKSAFFLRGKFYAKKTDFSFLLLGFRENLLAGLDITRSVSGAGFWCEAAYVFIHALTDDKTQSEDGYFRGSIGLDYSFGGKTYGFIEYHFNQPGSDKPENYVNNFSKVAFTDGAVYLLGKHYLTPGLTYQVTPLVILNGQTLFNITDPSLFLSLRLEYNIAENIYLAAGVYLGIGERPELTIENNHTQVIKYNSEFGAYPDIYFSSFRIYF